MNPSKYVFNIGKSDFYGAQYILDLLARFQLKNEELLEVFDYCKEKGKMPLCTPCDISSLKVLEEYGMQAYKVSSADLTNSELLNALIKTDKPLICSTGMSTEAEIKRTIKFFHDNQNIFKQKNLMSMDDLSSHRWTIDYQEDYEMIKVIYDKLYLPNQIFYTKEIIELIKKNPEIKNINLISLRSHRYRNNE